MRIENTPIELPNTNPERGTENHEKLGKEIAEERGLLLHRIIQRALQTREHLAQNIAEMPSQYQKIWSGLQSIPLVRGILVSAEGLLGSEPGKKHLNATEILMKYAIAGIMFAEDIVKIKRNAAGKTPIATDAGGIEPATESSSIIQAVKDFIESDHEIAKSVKENLCAKS